MTLLIYSIVVRGPNINQSKGVKGKKDILVEIILY